MPDRRILVFDEAGTLLPLVERAVSRHRFEVVGARDVARLLERLGERAAALLVIGVEAPLRGGFGAFIEARKARRRPRRILLCSASLSGGELQMHAKQRLHADAYLDASGLSPETLRKAFASLLRLGPRRASSDVAVPATSVAAGASSRSPTSPASRGELEIDIDACVSDALAAPAARPGPVETPPELQALTTEQARCEITTLREQLARAQRFLMTSPFADRFHELRHELEGAESRARAGSEEIDLERARTRAVAERLRAVEEREREALGRGDELEHCLQSAREEFLAAYALWQTQRQAQETQAAARLRHIEEIQRGRIERSQAELRDAELRAAGAIQRSDAERRAELTQQLEQLCGEHANALAEAAALADARLQRERDEHVATLAELRQRHARLDAAQREAHEETLGDLRAQTIATEARHRGELSVLGAEHEDALSELQREHANELSEVRAAERAERERVTALLSAEHRAQMQVREAAETRSRALAANHAQTLEQLEAEHAAALEALRNQIEGQGAEALADAARSMEDLVARARRDHAHELGRLRSEHSLEVETLRAGLEAQLRAEREQQAAALERARQSFAGELASTTAAHEQRLERLGATHAREMSELRIRSEAASAALGAQLSELRTDAQTLLAEAEQRTQATLQRTQDEQRSELAQQAERWQGERVTLVANAEARWRAELERAQARHDAELGALRSAHERELTTVLKSTGEQRDALREELELELQSTRELHAADLSTHHEQLRGEVGRLESAHSRALQSLDQQHALRLAELGETLRLLEREISEQKVVSIALKRQLVESEQAAQDALRDLEAEHSSLYEAREAEHAAELDQLREELRSDHENALETLNRNHQRLLRNHAQLLEAELKTREDDIARLSSEYEAKLSELRIEIDRRDQ